MKTTKFASLIDCIRDIRKDHLEIIFESPTLIMANDIDKYLPVDYVLNDQGQWDKITSR